MTRPARPDFIVMGAPKAGTTALHAALTQHPQIFMSDPKEPKYWMCDDAPPPHCAGARRHSTPSRSGSGGASDYERLFAAAPAGVVRGESTPFYLWHRAAQRRIAEHLPDAKLIAVRARPHRPRLQQLDAPVVRRPRAAGRLRGGVRAGARADRQGLGAVLALRPAGPVRRAAGRTCSATSTGSGSCVLRYRSIVDDPREARQPHLRLPGDRARSGRLRSRTTTAAASSSPGRGRPCSAR